MAWRAPCGLVLGSVLAAALGAPGARADAGRDIVRTCQAEWYLPRAVCSCVAEQAVGQFNDVQLQWLALGAGHPAEAAALSKAMSVAEGQAVTRFMVDAPHRCAAP
jgi:hypothetical protein